MEDTEDAEMKASSAEIPSLANVLTFKPGAGQNIASSFFHASSTARNTFFPLVLLSSPFLVYLAA